MNIKNRIQKLETQIRQNDPQKLFCECFFKHLERVLHEVYEGKEPPLSEREYPSAGHCSECGKPVSPMVKTFQRNLVEIYGQK